VNFDGEIAAVQDRVSALLDQAGELALDPAVLELRQELSTSLEELHVAAEELELKSYELSLAEQREREQRERSADIFALAPEAYVETDLNGAIANVNDKACELLSMPRRFIEKKLFVSFILNDDRSAFRSRLNDLRGDLTGCSFEVQLRCRDAVIRKVELAVVKRQHVAGTMLLWRIRDLSQEFERDRQFVDLFEQLDVARSAAGLSQVLMSEEHALDNILARLTSLASLATNAVASTVCLAIDLDTCQIDDDVYRDLHVMQIKRQSGPSIEAMQSNQLIAVDDLEIDERWPFLHEPAGRLAVHSALAVPLRVGRECVGVLTVYGRVPAMFTDHDVETLHALGSQAAFASANVRLYQSASDLAGGLETAMAHRAVIEQAKGMVMMREKCTADEAFAFLCRQSQTRNVKLRQLAQTIVESVCSKDRVRSS
jgi:PAS domain S-box-containing protein